MKKTILAFAICMMGIFAANNSFAQTATARMTDKFILQVPAETSLSSSYIVDVSSLNFTSVEQMEMYFSGFNDDIIRFDIDKTDKTVTLYVKDRYISGGKTPADLNAYLSNRAEKMKEKYQTMRSENPEK